MGQRIGAEEAKQAALELMLSALTLLDDSDAPPAVAAYLSQSLELLRQDIGGNAN